MATPTPMIFLRSVCSAMKEKSENEIQLSERSSDGLTHEPLDEESDGDDVEAEEIENVLPVLLQVGADGLPVL